MGTGEALDLPNPMSAYLTPNHSSGMPYSAAPGANTAPPQHQQQGGGRPDAGAYMGPPPPGSCLMCYNPQADVLLEPCHHVFHGACIERSLTKDKVCPSCWTPIQTPRRVMPQQHQQQFMHQNTGMQQTADGYPVDSKAHVLDGTSHNAAATNSTPTNGDGTAATAAPAAAPPTAMRKGKWTAEESAYCDRLIEEFKKGNLPLAEGTTLRTFLSKLLNCDPMRISKKYTGDQCIGKIIFRRREDEVSKEDMELIRKDLAELEKTYLEREQYNQRRREKRLESELSRDKNRFAAARQMNYPAGNGSAVARSPHQQQHQQIPPQQAGYPSTAAAVQQALRKPDPGAVPVQQLGPGYAGPGRPTGMPVQPPLHPPQQSNTMSSHIFNGDHSNVSMLGIASAQNQGQGQAPPQGQDNKSSNNAGMENGGSGDGFPRVSSIDSFSCLFPRVASIENFQHSSASSFGGMGMSASYASTENQNTVTSSGFDSLPAGLPKPMSIGEGLNAYFPRIQSLEQLSKLLQDPPANSPRGGASGPGAPTRDTRETSENTSDSNNRQTPKDNATEDARRRLGEENIKEEQQCEPDTNAQTESNDSSSNNDKIKDEDKDKDKSSSNTNINGNNSGAQASTTSVMTMTTNSSGATKRLSPSHSTSASSGSGNQIQIPKPLNKMPRSSSGIFPRVPSMDKMPRVPSIDKIPRVASLDKLPRIPSMDKLHTVGGGSEARIPRVPSSDKMARIPSSDMLSRFGSSDHLSSFPSFSNLSGLSSSASYDKLSSLGGGSAGFKSGFPRNSSIEDILSLVASSESTGMPSNGSTLQLSALAAVAGEESSHLASERKRRLDGAQQDTPLTTDSKKSRLST
ncbi:hypothetical protein PHYBOEH_007359 [Phytophthora boehmeriae]|uniref:RING-type domain-containing protein n=1 Tax=Phytophthora boehmeriae TaxID=109152 RepID=A0A8T1W8Y1_9STRA|nr:hypothetical protein PHYBOEH_007359 [Phytophthora boehmeriae]